MTTLKQLQALVEAGDKANQDIWNVVGLPWNTYTPYINTKSEDPHFGRAIIDVIEPNCIEGEDDEDIARLEQELKAEMYANMEFVSLAANSRPAIKAAIAELEVRNERYNKLEKFVHGWLAKLAPNTTNFLDAFKELEAKDKDIERLRDVVEDAIIASEWYQENSCDFNEADFEWRKKAKQALGACETTERSEDNDE